MKKYTLLFLLLTTCILTGCIRENMDDCRRGFTLLFRYDGDGTTDIFRQKVTKVNLYVYDTETRQLVRDIELDRSALETLQGIRLDGLEPGSYEAVCWGNADVHSSIEQPADKEQGSISAPEYRRGEAVPTNDELYYGHQPFVITHAWEEHTETCHFRCAHIDMYVRLEGFENIILPEQAGATTVADENTCPVDLQLVSLPGYCDFAGTANDYTTRYTPALGVAADNAAAYETNFKTLRFGDHGEAALQLTNPATGEVIYTLLLEQFMADNGLSVEKKQEVSLGILLKFNGGMAISVKPFFEEDDIHPGLDEKNQ